MPLIRKRRLVTSAIGVALAAAGTAAALGGSDSGSQPPPAPTPAPSDVAQPVPQGDAPIAPDDPAESASAPVEPDPAPAPVDPEVGHRSEPSDQTIQPQTEAGDYVDRRMPDVLDKVNENNQRAIHGLPPKP